MKFGLIDVDGHNGQQGDNGELGIASGIGGGIAGVERGLRVKVVREWQDRKRKG